MKQLEHGRKRSRPLSSSLPPWRQKMAGYSTTSADASTPIQTPPPETPLQDTEPPSTPGDAKASFQIFYNDVYEVHLPPNHRFPMSKYRQTRELLQSWMEQDEQNNQPTPNNNKFHCQLTVSPLATVTELETTHCPSYIQRYIQGHMTELEQRNVGFPWSEQSVQRSLSSVGGTVAAACHVLDLKQEQHLAQAQTGDIQGISTSANKNDNLELHWAAHIAAGTHHAFYDRGEGFSVFSDMAVAANVVLERYPHLVQRILFLDLDVHQGNGNAVLFQNNPNVATFSMHCKANYFSEKQESDLDIELPAGCQDDTYLITLQHWLKRLRQGDGGEFDLVFFQAGVDILEVDRLGRMSLTSEGVQRRNQMVYDFYVDLQVPLVICMGGGYPRGDNWAPVIEAHASVYYQAYQHLQNFANSRDGTA